jgi:hypothetical protein
MYIGGEAHGLRLSRKANQFFLTTVGPPPGRAKRLPGMKKEDLDIDNTYLHCLQRFTLWKKVAIRKFIPALGTLR